MGKRASHSAAAPQLVVQPFLDVDFPTTAAALGALANHNTYAYSVISPLFTLHEELAGAKEKECRAKVDAFLDRFFVGFEAKERMRSALAQTRTMLTKALSRYIPDAYQAQLGFGSENEVESFESLIADMFNRGRSKQARRRAFIARRRYYLLQFLLHLERSDASLHKSREAAGLATELLKDRFLAPGDASEQTLHTQHGPENDNRCLDARFQLPATWTDFRKSKVKIHTFRDLRGEEHPIMLQIRMKDPLAIIIRMLRSGLPHPEYVPDLRGIRIVCFSHEDRVACRETILDRFPIIRSTASDWMDLYSGTAVRRLNRFSSRYFRVLKFSAEFTQVIWEFQIMHVHDFVNLWYSNGEENWHRYRLRQLFALFFPRFFPKRIFGVRWGKDSVRRAFEEWALRDPREIVT